MSQVKNKATSILVVEDNLFDKLIAKVLLQSHFNIFIAKNGAEALKTLQEQKIDIILMDIELGDGNMNGTDVMKLIRKNENYNHIKIFAVTGHPENDNFYIKQGFDEVYIKPIIQEEMLEFLNRNMLKHS